jgi:hypothetical protein
MGRLLLLPLVSEYPGWPATAPAASASVGLEGAALEGCCTLRIKLTSTAEQHN